MIESLIYKQYDDNLKKCYELEQENAELRERVEELKKQLEEANYKFFYCESEDSYLLGCRVDNFYYAHWNGNHFCFDMSRYLPWGETIEDNKTFWKKHTYPSEPKTIGSNEWFNGFLKQQLANGIVPKYEHGHKCYVPLIPQGIVTEGYVLGYFEKEMLIVKVPSVLLGFVTMRERNIFATQAEAEAALAKIKGEK